MKRLMILLLGCLIGTSCFAQRVYTDSSKPITISKAEDTFVISLKANPTTGYIWFLKNANNGWIKIKSHQYKAPKDSKVGAPGTDVWTFKVDDNAFDAPQIAELVFIYTKPWDLKTQTQKVFTVLTTDQ